MRSQPECIRDCSSRKLKPLCGSDGLTYNSKCELKNARCLGRKVGVAHDGACTVGKLASCPVSRVQGARIVKTLLAVVPRHPYMVRHPVSACLFRFFLTELSDFLGSETFAHQGQ